MKFQVKHLADSGVSERLLMFHEGLYFMGLHCYSSSSSSSSSSSNNNNNNNNNNIQNDMIECVPNYTSTYARKQGYNWTTNAGMNMYQNQ